MEPFTAEELKGLARDLRDQDDSTSERARFVATIMKYEKLYHTLGIHIRRLNETFAEIAKQHDDSAA